MRLEDIYPAVLTIILIGLVLGIGIYILAEVSDEVSDTAGSVSNETGLWINQTLSTVDSATANGFNTFAVSTCYANVTGLGTIFPANTTIVSANYTVDSEVGTIISTTDGAENYTDVACSYTYKYGEEASAAIDETIVGLGDFAGWIAIIVVVIAAAIVLGIVLSSFGRKTPGV